MFTWPKIKQDVATVDREYIFYGPVKFTTEMEPFYLDEMTYAEISKKYDNMKSCIKDYFIII
jgi:hypothetical protein